MASPYELLAGLALLREKKRRSRQRNALELQEWSGFRVLLGDVACLIPCDQVEEVITPDGVATVRDVPAWVRGVVYCRAQLVTLVDVAGLLLGKAKSTSVGRVFVMRGKQEWFGLHVGVFDGVRHIWSDTHVCDAPASGSETLQQYVREWLMMDGIPVAVLDAARLVESLEQHGTCVVEGAK
jgi:chemotaxis signal transduction protein